MNLIDIFLLAIALGMDCLIVSFSQGLIFTSDRLKNSLSLAFTMGLFQGLMPFIGFFGTEYIKNLIEPFSRWLVFGIFFVLGVKFILEAFQGKETKLCCISLKCLIGLGIATSIDALVSGATLSLTNTPLAFSCLIIGIVSFAMSLTGFQFGNFLQKFPPKYLEICGGLILIFLALKSVL